MENLKVTYIQTALHWMSPSANWAMLEEKIFLIGPTTDIIVLPELFTTGFAPEAANFAEPMNLTTFKWMKQMAEYTQAMVIGSYPVIEKEKIFNRLIAMKPGGSYQWYDKRHLFSLGNEQQNFSSGNNKIIVEWKSWKICPFICYDLRFPVWSRQGSQDHYDLLLYIANWPQTRINAWTTLLKARAIENVSYVLGCNIIGADNQGNTYNGHSAIYNYKGEELFNSFESETINTVTLLKGELNSFRAKFPVLADADLFSIT